MSHGVLGRILYRKSSSFFFVVFFRRMVNILKVLFSFLFPLSNELLSRGFHPLEKREHNIMLITSLIFHEEMISCGIRMSSLEAFS